MPDFIPVAVLLLVVTTLLAPAWLFLIVPVLGIMIYLLWVDDRDYKRAKENKYHNVNE